MVMTGDWAAGNLLACAAVSSRSPCRGNLSPGDAYSQWVGVRELEIWTYYDVQEMVWNEAILSQNTLHPSGGWLFLCCEIVSHWFPRQPLREYQYERFDGE